MRMEAWYRLYRNTRSKRILVRCFATDPKMPEILKKHLPYHDDPPKFFNLPRDVLDFWARERKTSAALWFKGSIDAPETKLNYGEMSELSKKAAGLLLNTCSLRPASDKVLILLPKMPEYWVTMFGALRAGIEFSIATMQLTSSDISQRIVDFKPDCIISVPRKLRDIDEALRRVPDNTVRHKLVIDNNDELPKLSDNWQAFKKEFKQSPPSEGTETRSDDNALVFFTSGTTGSPKMVVHTHSYPLGHFNTGYYLYRLKNDDIFWCMADTGWAKVCYATFPTATAGACLFVDGMQKFDPNETLKTLRENPITVFCAPPTIYRTLVPVKNKNAFRFKSLQHCIGAGEPLNVETFEQWKELTGLSILQGFGQSETTVLCSQRQNGMIKPGSMGTGIPEVPLEILDDELKPCPVGTVGHLAIRVVPKKPLGVLKEYRPTASRSPQTFTGDYYLTGDKGMVDRDGHYWFHFRADDVITSAGYRIGPHEIESVLLEHDAVVESAAVGSPDPKRYEVVKAFIMLHPDFKQKNKDELAKELQEFVKQKTAPYKYPRKIEFVESLPKTPSGKIQRHLLRDQEYKKNKK